MTSSPPDTNPANSEVATTVPAEVLRASGAGVTLADLLGVVAPHGG